MRVTRHPEKNAHLSARAAHLQQQLFYYESRWHWRITDDVWIMHLLQLKVWLYIEFIYMLLNTEGKIRHLLCFELIRSFDASVCGSWSFWREVFIYNFAAKELMAKYMSHVMLLWEPRSPQQSLTGLFVPVPQLKLKLSGCPFFLFSCYVTCHILKLVRFRFKIFLFFWQPHVEKKHAFQTMGKKA